MKRASALLSAATLFAVAGSSVTIAASTTGSGLAATGQSGQSLVTKIHRCHRDFVKGRAGWHRHAGPNCRRIAEHRDGRHHRSRGDRYWYKGPRCSTYCVGFGPLRICDRDCD